MVLHATIFQLMNGVIMLLDDAPLAKASFHQMTGVMLLSCVIYLMTMTRTPMVLLRPL
jgi:heme A synthase